MQYFLVITVFCHNKSCLQSVRFLVQLFGGSSLLTDIPILLAISLAVIGQSSSIKARTHFSVNASIIF